MRAVTRQEGRTGGGVRTRPVPPPADAPGLALSGRWRPRGLGEPGRRRLLLLHVPKTGGSTLRMMIADHVPAEETFLSTGRHQWIEASVRDMQRCSAFLGHSFTVPLAMLPEDEWVSVLPVREPVAWWTSWYTYHRQRARPLGLEETFGRLTMDEWLRSTPDSELRNPQSSWLLSRHVLTWDHPGVRPGRLTDTALAAGADADVLVRGVEELVARASVVGTTDDLFGVYQRMCAAMGWEPRHLEALRENASNPSTVPGLTDLSPEQSRRLHELNGLDRYLHALARYRGTGTEPGHDAPDRVRTHDQRRVSRDDGRAGPSWPPTRGTGARLLRRGAGLLTSVAGRLDG